MPSTEQTRQLHKIAEELQKTAATLKEAQVTAIGAALAAEMMANDIESVMSADEPSNLIPFKAKG